MQHSGLCSTVTYAAQWPMQHSGLRVPHCRLSDERSHCTKHALHPHALPRRSKALKLAEKLDPGNIAHISKEHAASLEMIGEYAQANNHYQQVGHK